MAPISGVLSRPHVEQRSTSDDGERLLGMPEVAYRLGVPVETLRHWRKTGYGPQGERVGRFVKYRAADVAAFIAATFDNEATA